MFNIWKFLNLLVEKTDWYQRELFPNGKSYWDLSDSLFDVINFGSTSALNAFHYKNKSIKSANLALPANPLFGDQLLVKNFAWRVKKNGCIIISLCPFSSLSGGYRDLDDIYYTLLPISSIPFSSPKRRTKILLMKNQPLRYFPLIYPAQWLSKILFHKFRRMNEDNMIRDAYKWMSNWKKEFRVTDDFSTLSEENIKNLDMAADILNEIVRYCKDLEVRPVLIVPPVYHTLGRLFTPEIRKKVIDSLIDKLSDKNVWFRNYMDDSEFLFNKSYFFDSFLMNKKGAEKFTQKVLCDLGYDEGQK